MNKIKGKICKSILFFLCIGLIVNAPIKTYASNIMTIQDFGSTDCHDIGVNRNGDIIVNINDGSPKIQEIKINSDGTTYGTPNDIPSLNRPNSITAMTVDKAGNIFFADREISDTYIKEIKVNGDGETYSNPPSNIINVSTDNVSQIVVDGSGNIFYVDGNGDIKEIKVNNGTYENPVDILHNNHIGFIAIDSHGNIFVTSGYGGNNTIKEIKVNNDGTYSLIQEITNPGSSGISQPGAIAIDSHNNIFVIDCNNDGNNAIKKIKAEADGSYNTITTIAASGINVPLGISVDDNGNIFICELHCVKKLLPTTVKYDANGGTGTAITDDTHYYTNDTVTVKENNNTLIKSGYVFGGWNTKADGTGINYDPADTHNNTFIIGDSDVTLYAKWIPTVIGVAAIQDIKVANGTTKNNMGLPAEVTIQLSNSTTISAAVTWDNGTSVSDGTSYNGNAAGTYYFEGTLTMLAGVVNPNNLKASVNVIVKDDNNSVSETTPAAVMIVGTEKAGNTLSAELLDNNDDPCTTSAAVTYEWYRLNNRNDGFINVIGNNKTYTLTDADAGKYIGLSAECDGKSFTAVSGQILEAATNDNPSNNSGSSSGNSGQSSGSSGSSSGHNHHDSATTDDVAAATQGGSQAENGSGNTKTVPPDGWFQGANGWEYLKNGKPVTGWQEIKGIWYLFDASGIMQTGWKEVNGAWYLLKDNGAMATGWQISGSKWYFMKDNGEMAKGWQQVNGIWYLLKEDGSMAIGWQEADGKWYYLHNDGSMAKNTSVDGCNVGDDGAWIK